MVRWWGVSSKVSSELSVVSLVSKLSEVVFGEDSSGLFVRNWGV